MAKKRIPLPECPIETALQVIANRWRVRIIRLISDGVNRPGELVRRLNPVSRKVLTDNLRALESYGILARAVFPETPPHVEYTLTPAGESLRPVLQALADWGLR